MHLAQPRPFWREGRFSGEVVSDGGVVQVVFDDTPEDGRWLGALVAFMLGDAALERLTPRGGRGGGQVTKYAVRAMLTRR